MIQRLETVGSKVQEKTWDDGSEHDDVTAIYVSFTDDRVRDFCVDYITDGQSENGLYKTPLSPNFTMTFNINHRENEYLQSFEGYFDGGTIRALQFKTNLKVSQMMGYIYGTKFSLAVDGKKIIGFHGSFSNYYPSLESLGAYFTGIAPTRMEARGGKGGTKWDDGSPDHEGVTKIEIRSGVEGIQYIKFEYVINGKTKHGPIRGRSGKGIPLPLFEINHFKNEYLVSVDGYYNEGSGIIQGLQFKTNINTSEMMGFEIGKRFSIASPGKKITGFHGYAGKNLNSLGAYFQTLPITKLEVQGNGSNFNWDDGAYDGVRKVYVYHDSNYVNSIAFDYENSGRVVTRKHGTNNGKVNQEKEFVVNFPNEYITSVGGTFVDRGGITSLTFKTSKGRISPTYGTLSNGSHTKLVLENNGCALVGFYGSSYGLINSLGAYFSPTPPPPAGEKLEALGGSTGGDGGASWDDGSNFDGVRKIYIGKGEVSIAFVKFMYNKDTAVVIGADHGSNTLHGVEEFELDYPSEYITTVEGNYDIVHGSDDLNVILMLRFKTNKRTSPAFGFGKISSFVHHKKGYKIVGFHGISGNMLQQIGVHVLPITDEASTSN
ncbi:PREDICTED: jacalin-related lectin 16-like isoform X1 [Camelina sativa]|uniref:Jacalin-related lectin 16-like isoform X1 n=1 Tax=Camelina sativa TaxID=90675 RepID=A0ABM1QPJ9_CAMSA|nr:PREDICTED: jacalin-related lectin 16-like isoform X1 [Camelina sativa]